MMTKELLLQEYDEDLDTYQKLESLVTDLIARTLDEGGIHPMLIAHRVKTRDSVAGKLERKPEKYPTVGMMNDLIGFRIICYFAEQVDQMAELIGKVLDVDPKLSSDKRKLMEPTAFGYLSLHYICRLPKDKGYPEKLTQYTFEIQFRTVLQHAWAEIEHDLGYKTEFGIPLDVRREFSRVAGLLEIADETFSVIKSRIRDYVDRVRESIKEDRADSLRLDLNTLTEFMHHSRAMEKMLTDICAFSGAVLTEVSVENYLERLHFFNMETLGDLTRMMDEEYEHAMMLAQRTLAEAELDELATTVGLYYLCRAKLVFGEYREDEIRDYVRLTTSDPARIKTQVDGILRQRKHYIHE